MVENFSVASGPPRCRPATPEGSPAIARVVVAAWQAAYVDLVPKAVLDALDPVAIGARWQKDALPAREFRQVVTLGGAVVGACTGGPVRDEEPSPSTAELYSINVHPEHWGQGVGRALLRCAEAAMLDRGFTSALLWVLAGNARAQRFYSLAGLDGHQ